MLKQIERRLCVRKNSRERLIDLVGDSTRQFTHYGNPHQVGYFLAPQLGLGFGSLLLGDIDKKPVELICRSPIVEM